MLLELTIKTMTMNSIKRSIKKDTRINPRKTRKTRKNRKKRKKNPCANQIANPSANPDISIRKILSFLPPHIHFFKRTVVEACAAWDCPNPLVATVSTAKGRAHNAAMLLNIHVSIFLYKALCPSSYLFVHAEKVKREPLYSVH
jgi:hypothetical protein